MTRRLLLSAVALAALVAAGCGGSGESSEPVATTEVAMAKSYRFDPKAIEVEAGQTVTWTNDDNFTHTVQVDGQEDHEVEQGESVSITFDDARHLPLRLHAAPPGHGRRGDRQVSARRARGRRRHPRLRGQRRHPRRARARPLRRGRRRRASASSPRPSCSPALAVWLTLRPASVAAPLAAAAAVFAGLLGSYALAVTTGLPVLHPEPGAGRRPRARHQGDRGRRPARGGEPPPAARRPAPSRDRKEHLT